MGPGPNDIQDNIASIELFNQGGLSFATYTYSSQVDEGDYNQLSELESVVRDRYFKITESEELIISGLESL